MRFDPEAAARVRRLLSGRDDVAERTMVGGLSFLVNGNMCCGVTGTALMIRVGADGREQVARAWSVSVAASATGHPGLVTSAGGIGSASAARPGAAGKGSAKYWVSCVTRSPVNSMTLTEYEGTPS